ncbi:hypothetical protein EHQ53_16945 [Leptospira langatensis]|uniref:Uncharacterized protein n=1 Tax=Leptospira langatensis TaxID=2484983 RepID=A0A5F1ZP73_9LEPT|nr:hypothetical protein [Leptospira langatensis]TGK05325.1 hypothetical protein EHO57_01185 [Leptospira langatensis]TGL38461.1 hypothetical protein EHQ53_16945 [Leptospira langatensis]
MNRDILKILLSGLLILLLGSLAVYIVLQKDKIASWYKEKQDTVATEDKGQNERIIIPMDEMPNGKDLNQTPNFDSETPKPKENLAEPSTQAQPKPEYEMPGLGPEKKDSLHSSKSTERSNQMLAESKETPPKESFDSPRTKVREDKIEYDDVPRPKKEKHLRKKRHYTRSRHHSNLGAKLSSLEKRVGRLEKKLGVKSSSSRRKAKNLSLKKRVEILENEVSTLKKKSKED